ncbi:hypothetical protein [Allobranchiibius sp. GilTou38]|uniref:hypothetical protein n=1 Tax=Allobranchiibius sp. GilTou38 TaxID=2815210 RepID=UPI001AA1196C|nr:hypothetical protein [Allobranchiibius sp. GilTou38]MBO1767356.1 hypothetical protein [Allobranchiibius sp. GilTou38]
MGRRSPRARTRVLPAGRIRHLAHDQKKQAELLKYLKDESKGIQADEEEVNKRLESDKAKLEHASGQEAKDLDDDIEEMGKKSAELTDANNTIQNRIREVGAMHPAH